MHEIMKMLKGHLRVGDVTNDSVTRRPECGNLTATDTESCDFNLFIYTIYRSKWTIDPVRLNFLVCVADEILLI
jgi:hypothetical protein